MQSDFSPPPQPAINNNVTKLTQLGSYIRGQIIRRSVTSTLVAVVSTFLVISLLQDLLFWNDIQGSVNPALFVATIIALSIPFAAIASVVVNLVNIQSIRPSYQSFNEHFYKPLWKFLGVVNAIIAAISFLRFLNPGGWLLQLDRKPDFLLDTVLHGTGSYASFSEANRAEILQELLARYFELLDSPLTQDSTVHDGSNTV